MSQSLYRKYRSQRFADLVGQQTVVRILLNAIQRSRLSHAYLFCGPRGTGKTSVARIFAKAINCLAPKDGDCCGECANCIAITQGSAVDVIEMDAASNRGIDDVRELRDKIQRGPLQFKYKTYIIDEVHMISREGFNALLKTLEEPPAHAIFCLCTTEAEKLPVTIRSRCIRFDFQRLALDALAKHLQRISSAEGFALADDAALELATMAEGSARDAISLLDQLTIYCSESITLPDIRTLFQLGDPKVVPQLLDELAAGNTGAALEAWDDLLKRGTDPQRFLLNVASELKLRYLASGAAPLRAALQAAWTGLSLMKQDGFPALLVELTLIEIQTLLTAPAALAPVATAEPRASGPAVAATALPPAPQAPAPEPPATASRGPATVKDLRPPSSASVMSVPEVRAPAAPAPPPRSEGLVSVEQWELFCRTVGQLRLTASVHLRSATAGRLEGKTLSIIFPGLKAADYHGTGKPEHRTTLDQAAERVFGPGTTVRLELIGQTAQAEAQPGSRHPGSIPIASAGSADAPADSEDIQVYDEDSSVAPSRVDPERLSTARARMELQIDAAAGKPEPQAPVTIQQAIDLFEAVEIVEE